MNLPQKYLIQKLPENYTKEQKDQLIAHELKLLDKSMVKLQVPTILLERLKREFDESQRQLDNPQQR